CNGVSPLEPASGLLYGFEQVAGVQVVDQMCDDFGIGLAFKNVAGVLQLCAQLIVVLDNAVVNKRNLGHAFALAGKMRMGIMGGRRPVRCPAGVGDTGVALQVLIID